MSNQNYSLKQIISQMYQKTVETLQVNPQKKADFPNMIASLGSIYGPYMLGLMSADEAFEIYTVQKNIAVQRLNSMINLHIAQKKVSGENLTALRTFQKSLETNKPVVFTDLMTYSIPSESIERCIPSLNDALTEMHRVNTVWVPGIYNEIFEKLKTPYELPLQQFIDLSTLISYRHQNRLMFLPEHFDERTKYQKLINVLYYLHNIMTINAESKQMPKANESWFCMAYTLYAHLVDDIAQVSRDDMSSDGAIQKNCQELKQLLPTPLQQKTFDLHLKKLTTLIRDYICRSAPILVESFDDYLQPFLTDLLPVDHQEAIENNALKQSSSSSLKKDLNQVYRKLLIDYGMEEISNPTAPFCFFSDYEILYFMGIFNLKEYELCQKYAQKEVTITVPKRSKDNFFAGLFDFDDDDENDEEGDCETAIVSVDKSINEIFETILDLPETGYYVLPLKKEYLAAVQQLKLAGSVSFCLCDADNEVITEMMSSRFVRYQEGQTFEEVEAYFLQGLIMIAKKLPNAQNMMKKLTLLSDGYWTESVLKLKDLPAYEGRSDLKNQVNEHVKWLNNMPKTNLTTFSKRRNVYAQVLYEMDKAIANQMISQPQQKDIEYNKMWYQFQNYIKLFNNNYLKITNKEYVNKIIKDLRRPEKERQ